MRKRDRNRRKQHTHTRILDHLLNQNKMKQNKRIERNEREKTIV